MIGRIERRRVKLPERTNNKGLLVSVAYICSQLRGILALNGERF
jgi:hypothetical protein